MMKKILALVLVLTLVLGMLPATAMAAAESTTSNDGYLVGYSKVDINPYWKAYIDGDPENRSLPSGYGYSNAYDMLPLPMGGYGNNNYRLSRAKLVDDNGSGYGMTKTSLTKNTITYDPNTTAVHLDDNRYSKAYAISLFGGEDTDAFKAYKDWAQIKKDSDWGENDGDGLWATAVFVEDASGSPLLILGVDNIGMSVDMIQLAKKKILEACKDIFPALTADRIMINCNHTHGGPSLGEDYASTGANATKKYYFWDSRDGEIITYKPSSTSTTTYNMDPGPGFESQELHKYIVFYRTYLTEKLGEAAAAAIKDRKDTAAMYKGSEDGSEVTGLRLNGVRHNEQTYKEGDKPELTYVRGSSFNVDLNGDGSGDSFSATSKTVDDVTYKWGQAQPVTESDDTMHMLQFTFEADEKGETAKPVILVNWRAHSTANNKQATKALHYNLSADWGASLRYELEKEGYRVALLYGSSGNLGTGVSGSSDRAIPSDYIYYMTDANLEAAGISNDGIKRYMMPGVYYGKQVARVAKALLSNIGEVEMGPIRSLQKYELQEKRDWPITYYYAAKAHNQLLKTESIQYPWVYKSSATDYSTYDPNGKVVTVSKDDNTPVVIASQYHASHVISKYESTSQSFVELNVLMLGEKVAFATTPVEASDRYFRYNDETDLPSAKTTNLWDNLVNDDAWGTPFVLSLTNGSQGYVPNMYAYDYNFDYYNRAVPGETGKTFGEYYTIAIGSYESQSAWADRGEGERMVEVLNTMLRTLEKNQEPQEKTFYCAACGCEKTYAPLIPGHFQADNMLHDGHYYLADNSSSRYCITISAGETVCLELNGKTFYSGVRAFDIYGTLNIQDSSTDKTGILKGRAVKDASGATLYVRGNGVVNQHSGKFICEQVSGIDVSGGGVVFVARDGTYNMYGGTIEGGKAKQYGGNVYVSYGTLNMYGGTIKDGGGDCAGKNVLVSGNPGTFRYVGGYIPSVISSKTEVSTHLMGTIYLGDKTITTSNSGEAVLGIKNDATVQLDGVFAGQVKLNYASSKVYTPAEGAVIGDVTAGSRIDYANGAAITVVGAENLRAEVVDDKLQLVVPVTLDSVAIAMRPDKTEYRKGESLDLSGLKLTATYSNGSTQEITAGVVYVSGYDPDKVGTQTVTVAYEGKEVTFEVTVIRELIGIQITKLPAKVEYYVGDRFDTLGLQVTLTYSDNTRSTISSGFTTEGFDSATPGEKTVTVKYGDFEDTFTVIVQEMPTSDFVVGGVGYDTLEAAMAVSSAKNPVVLNVNVDEIRLTKTTYLDLNGHNVASVTTDSNKLYVMDSATADFDVSDGNYGKILAADEATNVKAMTGYLKAANEMSFHKYEMKMTNLVVNTIQRGITYKSSFKGDQFVQAQIKEFGIAMRAYNAPNETSIWADPDCKTHVALTKEQWTNNAIKSVYVSNIIDPTLDADTNQARAQVGIFGRAYILLEDGTMIFGEATDFSMQSAMEYVDYYFDSEYLDAADRQNLVNFYTNPAYMSFMETWKIPNIKAAAAKAN